jgi:poly(hydroxyalkanoate) depolymerase family esterase
MHASFQDLMHEATRLTRAGRLDDATRTIQRALGGTAPHGFASRPAADSPIAIGAPQPDVIDGCVTEIDPPTPRGGSGSFVGGTHTVGSMTRDYKLFVPPGAQGQSRPLVVMLHGCTQDPDDFAAGTGMNERALEQGVVVLYPAQSRKANPQGCWNWFKHTHQQRHRGETGLIASMTQSVVERLGIDPRRVYIAGLSAGGAMATVVAACWPERFAAVGVHSGLAPGVATTLPEAMAAMQGAARPANPGTMTPPRPALALTVPTIVFHGDRDPTVHPSNAERIVAAVTAGRGARAHVEHGTSAQGRRYTRRLLAGDGGRPDVEQWIVHGAGHAWSGGRRAGSYTDPSGPDASEAMLRFFLEHPRATPH